MKYYLLVGEPSGDLHASHLMRSLKRADPDAEFRFYGGDLMAAVGGSPHRHYKDLAYMGFVPVLLHLRTILAARRECKRDIAAWQPDAVILVDYPGFNLNIAKYLHKRRAAESRQPNDKPAKPQVFYYISPKIWAWKEYRIKDIKTCVDRLFSILPFEVPFFEGKHRYPVSYVGNPTANEVSDFKKTYSENHQQYCLRLGLDEQKPVIALLAGSRRQEVKDNLRMMIAATAHLTDYQLVLAGVPSLGEEIYGEYLAGTNIRLVFDDTYALLSHATAALVTSGTATLETACFRVPQVVLYKTPLPRLSRFVWDHFFSVRYISLVNLIADSEVVPEMMAEKFRVELVRSELDRLLTNAEARQAMLRGYDVVAERLGESVAHERAAREIVQRTG